MWGYSLQRQSMSGWSPYSPGIRMSFWKYVDFNTKRSSLHYNVPSNAGQQQRFAFFTQPSVKLLHSAKCHTFSTVSHFFTQSNFTLFHSAQCYSAQLSGMTVVILQSHKSLWIAIIVLLINATEGNSCNNHSTKKQTSNKRTTGKLNITHASFSHVGAYPIPQMSLFFMHIYVKKISPPENVPFPLRDSKHPFIQKSPHSPCVIPKYKYRYTSKYNNKYSLKYKYIYKYK